jgi:hypothetical protein
MAQKVNVILVSDMSGEELSDGNGETVSFALDGTTYELDLSNKEADKFRGQFQDYIAVARKTSGGRGRKSSGSSRSTSGSGRGKDELAEIRAWAKKNGHEVSERGRIKQDVLDAYDAAH